MEEIRLDIPWWEWMYQISNLFNVKSLCRKWVIKEYILKQKIDSKWYVYVSLTRDHKAKHILFHRLIAKIFIPNPERKQQINHKDWNPKNNSIQNLERVTCGENQKHRYNVLWQKWNMYGKFWSEHNKHKDYVLIKNR